MYSNNKNLKIDCAGLSFCRNCVFILAALIIFSVPNKAADNIYVNKKLYFTISFSDNWTQIPRDSIRSKEVLRTSQNEKFDFLYQNKDSVRLFSYPYILLQAIRPSGFPSHSNNSLLEKIPRINDEVLSRLDNKMYLDESTGRVWQKSEINGVIRITCFIEKNDYNYHFYFYSRKESFQEDLKTFFSIYNTFRILPQELITLRNLKEKADYIIPVLLIGFIYFLANYLVIRKNKKVL